MKKAIRFLLVFVLIPVLVVLSYVTYKNKNYMLISFLIASISVAVMLLKYNNRDDIRGAVIISVLIAFSVGGRFIFGMLPGFKPVTAITMIAGIYLGSEAGFLTGSLSALISNFYFGQGPWTPFQMFAWGIIGYIVGSRRMSTILKKNRLFVVIVSILSGVVYSLIMDIWTTLSVIKGFSLDLYFTKIITSLPFMAVYALSNVVFMLFLQKPIGQQIERIKIKYGIMEEL